MKKHQLSKNYLEWTGRETTGSLRHTNVSKVALALFVAIGFQAATFGSSPSTPFNVAKNQTSASQADIVVTGKVTDAAGSALVGVSIKEKGIANGVITKADGTFSLKVANENAVLQISYLGFQSQELAVRGKTSFNIVLEESSQSLNEVVVVGYGTQRKADVTGAVASVNLEDFHESPNTNLAQYLQGTVPGLNVGVSTNAGGTPPIQIRGQVSLNGSTNPLIILDGIQYNNSLSSINPDDIASIDILKDASSTAVYGAQAANGVILITSRKGKANQPPRINFSSAATTQNPTSDLRPMDREEYLAGVREGWWRESYLAPDFTTPNPAFNIATRVDPSNLVPNSNPAALKDNNFNWWDEATRKGLIVENTLSISGGGDRFTYLLSGGMVNQKNTIINDIFKRKSIRANLETKALSWWKVGLVGTGSFVNQDGAEPAFGSIIRMSPLLTPYDANGSVIVNPTNTLELNPFLTYFVDDRERNNYYFANIYSDIDFPFLKGLNYRLNFGNNLRNTDRAFSSIYGASQTGEAFRSNEEYYDYTLDNILTYTKSFNKHDFTGTLLYGASERKFSNSQARATGFSRLNLSYNNIGLGTSQFATSGAWEEALNYQMARVNYKYNDRYLITATVRRDGFSGFAKNNKSAVFPVLALGWVASEESFLKSISAINFLKFRAGYGEIGNQTSRYYSLDQVQTGPANAYIFGDGGATAPGQQVNKLGNPDLKWERTRGLNIGTDFNLFGSRLNGSLEYYNNNTYDLLFDVTIPNLTGFSSISSNVGQLRNRGFEASLTGNIIRSSKVNWSSTLNFSTNNNKIITLTGVDANKDGKEDDLTASGLFIGKSINTIYYYQTDGIYQLNDTRLPGFPIGALRIVDQDNSGTITTADRTFLGRREAAYRVSLFNSVGYKGFTLTAFINSVQGGKDGYLGNDIPSYFREDNSIRANNYSGLDFWSPANPNGTLPRIVDGTRSPITDELWVDRSFIRLQDVSLSYNFAGNLLKKVKAKNINLYVSGKNVATWTKWKGLDPEVNEITATVPASRQMAIGRQNTSSRPVMRAFTLGINVTY